MKDKTFIALSGIFFLLFFIGIAVLTIGDKQLNLILRAKDTNPSALKSFGIAFPQISAVEGNGRSQQGTKIKISIYIRDIQGSVLADRSVKLTSDNISLTISPADTAKTNDFGQAEFYISSQNPGKVKLVATDIGTNTEIVNIPSVEFVK